MTTREPPEARRERRRRQLLPTVVLIALLVGGGALRIHYVSRCLPHDDDYATAALMSKHILEGRDYPLYYYGYSYISTIGSYVGALTFALFGQSFFSLALAMLPFSLLWIAGTFLLFRRLVSDWGGVVAAALVAFPSLTLLKFSSVPLIGYPTTLAFGTLILYFGVRLHTSPVTSAVQWRCFLGLAALAGLAIWTHPLCLPYLIMGFGLLVAHIIRERFSRATLIKLAVAAVVFAAAVSPVIVTAHERGTGELFGHWAFDVSLLARNASVLVTGYVPDQLLAHEPTPMAVNALIGAVYGLLAAAFLVGLAVGIARHDARLLRATAVPLLFACVFLVPFLLNAMTAARHVRLFLPFHVSVVACVAFPFVWGRPWIRAVVAAIVFVVVGYNIVDSMRFIHGPVPGRIAEKNAALERLGDWINAQGFRHVLVEGYGPQTLTFLCREHVVFAAARHERHYPYAVQTAAADTAAFLKGDADTPPSFTGTLDALGITEYRTAKAPELNATVFYDLVLPGDHLRLVEPDGAVLVDTHGRTADASLLIDRHDETVVGDSFDAASALVVDFGQEVRLCAARLVAPFPQDYPGGYTLWVSMDGEQWRLLQHVEDREAQACIAGNRFYYRDRHAPMECRFPTTTLRYLKLGAFHTAAAHFGVRRFPFRVWRFQEAYFYAPDESEHPPEMLGRPDRAEAEGIARQLETLGATRVIADQWLSRKIELTSACHLAVLPRYEWRHLPSHVSRTIPLHTGLAVAVERAHADEAGRRLTEAVLDNVAITRHDFPHYTAYLVTKAPAAYAAFPGLRWNGVTLVGTARIATADWYHRHGTRLDASGHPDAARACFDRSFRTFPGIKHNLERLAAHNPDARATLDALTPEHLAEVRLPHGVSLVGYTLTPEPLVPGRPATLALVWRLEGTVKHDYMQVFVHFLDGEERVFQADHNATFPVTPGSSVPPALVLDEHTFVAPDDAPAGTLTIHLGATSVANSNIRLKPRTKLPVHNRAVEIGRVRIAP